MMMKTTVCGEKLKYTKEVLNVYTLPTGLRVWDKIDSYYKDYQFRDKVICRIDVVKLLTDTFSKKTLEAYRNAIFNIASLGISDPEKLSNMIITLAKNDVVFASKLNEYYYTCDIDCSFGEYIITSLANKILYYEDFFRQSFRGMTQSVICLSAGYLYICLPDVSGKHWMPCNAEVEVLSYAKNWRGETYC